jgi:hypothetical protein
MRKILSHGTGTSGQSIWLTLEAPFETALSVTSTLTMVQNPYYNVIVQATTPVAPAVGISPAIIATGYYGWIQTGGVAAGLPDAGANFTVDTLGVAPSTTTAGCIAVHVEANNQYLGFAMQVVSVDAYEMPVFLTID